MTNSLEGCCSIQTELRMLLQIMRYFVNTDINEKKSILISLKEIYGLGPNRIKKLCGKFGLKPNVIFNQIPYETQQDLERYIEKHYTTGDDLRKETINNIQILKDFRSFKGSRLRLRLPRRGQRTHTNAKTSRRNT